MKRLLNRICRLLRGKTSHETSPRHMPSWSEIVEIMHDDAPLCYSDEVVRVIYSDDQEKRFVLLKRQDGLYRYSFERLTACDEDEWRWNSIDPDELPGYWAPMGGGISLFSSEQEAWHDLVSSPEYKTFFQK